MNGLERLNLLEVVNNTLVETLHKLHGLFVCHFCLPIRLAVAVRGRTACAQGNNNNFSELFLQLLIHLFHVEFTLLVLLVHKDRQRGRFLDLFCVFSRPTICFSVVFLLPLELSDFLALALLYSLFLL